MNENALNCPWSNMTPGSFPLCEEALCAWIKQPANAYSNILFFILGLYLVYLYFRRKSSHGPNLGLCIIIIGCASFIAHSSGTKLFGFFDFAAIFAAFSYYAAVNAKSLKRIKAIAFGFAGFITISLGTLYFFNFLREVLFASFVIGLLFSEYRILKSQGKSFFIASNKKVLVTFGIGIIFLALDSKKIVCDPNNHYFQMHALWHICDAVSLFFLTRHLDEHRS